MSSIYSGSSEGATKDLPQYLPTNKRLILQARAKDIQLQKELKSLTKANEVDVRSQLAKELQFRTQYEKYLTRGNLETSLLKKETFKRIYKDVIKPNVDIKPDEHIPLHKLIYTNGEVDIEKVVCLSLLTVQYFDTTSKVEKRCLSLFPKRSKPNMLEASALPFYILEIIHRVNTEPYLELREGQDVMIVVNSNVEKLIISILEVLAIVSPKKLQLINELSINKRAIQEIMIKTKIHNFLAQVKECPALFMVENYRFEIARYQAEPSLVPNVLSLCRVRVKDRSGKLELIQKEIKAIITKYSESKSDRDDSWSMFHKKFCSCRKSSSKNSLSAGKGISLLHEDGTEFALVTVSGCHLPSGSSVFCPSLTAIIKSSPNPRGYNIQEDNSRFSLNQRGFPQLKTEQRKLTASLLYKVNNSQRILIGKKAAEFKSQSVMSNKPLKQRTPINKIIEEVFTKESLISFASTTENEELKLLFQPCCKGGLGIGSFILRSEKFNPNSNNKKISIQTQPLYQCEDEVCPQIIKQEKSLMNIAIIKQDIFTSETRTKMKKFLTSDNPGPPIINNRFN